MCPETLSKLSISLFADVGQTCSEGFRCEPGGLWFSGTLGNSLFPPAMETGGAWIEPNSVDGTELQNPIFVAKW